MIYSVFIRLDGVVVFFENWSGACIGAKAAGTVDSDGPEGGAMP